MKDVSFDIRQGDVVGIIGRNGAGKSTLLKILSRITEPTTGRVRLRGRVASLLEVGTGFHPELTGRENIFLNGAILGMKRAEIRAKFDEIVAFAEVEKFLDTPVKRYSSGMYVRLAFAVAAHLEPEILIIDEVLAVGDAQFQKKCLGQMGEVAKGGRTVLFVSHNMGAVKALCSRGLLLSAGHVVLDTTAAEVCARYLSAGSEAPERQVSFDAGVEGKFRFTEVAVLGPGDSAEERLDIDSEVKVRVRYRISVRLTGVVVGIRVHRDGILLFNSFDTDEDVERLACREPGSYETMLSLPRFLLGAGRYSLSLLASIPATEQLDGHADVLSFDLQDDHHDLNFKSYAKMRGAMLIMPIKWDLARIAE